MTRRQSHRQTAESWSVAKGRALTLDRARIMAILNVTPDSFSDGGQFSDPESAVAYALQCVAQGADIIDVGGESTRPGATRVQSVEQIRRVVPVIAGIAAQSDVLISIDTTLGSVAAAALEAGASILNDVSAGREDARIFELAGRWGAGLVLMHRRVAPDEDRYSDQYTQRPEFDDVVGQVYSFLSGRIDAAKRIGVKEKQIVIDPGLGFGKDVSQNLDLIACIDAFSDLGAGVLSAASRKSFIGSITGVSRPADRLAGTLAVSISHWLRGVRLFRVHDVAAHAHAFSTLSALSTAGGTPCVDGPAQ